MQVGYGAERGPVKTHSSEKENKEKIPVVLIQEEVEHHKLFDTTEVTSQLIAPSLYIKEGTKPPLFLSLCSQGTFPQAH